MCVLRCGAVFRRFLVGSARRLGCGTANCGKKLHCGDAHGYDSQSQAQITFHMNVVGILVVFFRWFPVCASLYFCLLLLLFVFLSVILYVFCLYLLHLLCVCFFVILIFFFNI